jgi:hypothetical protein
VRSSILVSEVSRRKSMLKVRLPITAKQSTFLRLSNRLLILAGRNPFDDSVV